MKPLASRLALVAAFGLASSAARAGGDIDGDGFDDLVVASPYIAFLQPDDGAWFVLRGAPGDLDGTSAIPRGFLAPNTDPDVGAALAVGDFDGDGFSDVAVAAPDATVDGIADAGVVLVRYGIGGGAMFDPARDLLLHQNVPGVPGEVGLNITAPQGEHFGYTMATGDFDGNGCADLAISVIDTVSGWPKAGAVHVFYGKKKKGLVLKKTQYWTEDSKGVKEQADQDDLFGYQLCAGDYNGDGRDDLAIFVKDHGGPLTVVAVSVLFGSKKGLATKKSRYITETDLGLPLPNQPWIKSFADGVAAGDFDGDGCDELVIGIPGESVGGVNGGAFHVVPGSKQGPVAAGQLVYSQATPGVPGSMPSGIQTDGVGEVFAVGDFNGDGVDDLAVGAPSDDETGADNSGDVIILFGSAVAPRGLITLGAQMLHQNILAIGSAEPNDEFGFSLATGDFNGDGVDDLATGVVGEDLMGVSNMGMVDVFFGQAGVGFPFAPLKHHYRGDGAIPGSGMDADGFGLVLGK